MDEGQEEATRILNAPALPTRFNKLVYNLQDSPPRNLHLHPAIEILNRYYHVCHGAKSVQKYRDTPSLSISGFSNGVAIPVLLIINIIDL